MNYKHKSIIIIICHGVGPPVDRSGLTYPEVSSKVYHDSFCHLGSSVSSPWIIYFEAFYLHVVSSFSCIPVICTKFVLFLTPLQFVHLFCNSTAGLTLLWAHNPFWGNFNHWQVSWKEAGQIFFSQNRCGKGIT